MAPESTGPPLLPLVAPASVLAVAALADAWNAGAVFYAFLVGVPVASAAALAALGRFVDLVNEDSPTLVARLELSLAGLLVIVFVVGAAAHSPAALAEAAPGLGRAALAFGFAVVFAQALAAVVPVRR